VNLPKHGGSVVFTMTREEMRKGHPTARFLRPAAPTVPPVTLPIDWTGNAAASLQMPMDGNDQYGDCMVAMACHCDNVRTWMLGKGTESTFDVNALTQWYLNLAGGDNGLDEGTLLQGWKQGLVNNSAATVVDYLDIDVNDSALTRYAMDQGFDVCLMWSVPDAFLNDFQTGARFDSPGIPNPNNGHGTPLIDCGTDGDFRLWTWGGWCWVSPAFVASVEPGAFVVFSTRGFDPKTGLDAKGVHITQRAQTWQTCGGKAIPASVISAFPPVGPPVHTCPVGQHWDDATQMCVPDVGPPPTGEYDIKILAGTPAGSYTVGGTGGFTPDQIAALTLAEDAIATATAGDALKAELLKYATAPGTSAADTAAIERLYAGTSFLHKAAQRIVERRARQHILEAAAKAGITLDMAAIDALPPGAILPPGWLQALLAALPQIMAFIQAILKMFGIGAMALVS
jgi:hypothetical protein